MLRISVELVPFGVEAAKRTIGTLEIGNVQKLENGFCRYVVRATTDNGQPEIWPSVIHWRENGLWILLQTVLNERFP